MPREYHEPPAPLKNSEHIADLIAHNYSKMPHARMPYIDQESQETLIAVNKNKPDEMKAARIERNELAEIISVFLDEEIEAGLVDKVTETQRGEIIELAIKKLVRQKKDLKKR